MNKIEYTTRKLNSLKQTLIKSFEAINSTNNNPKYYYETIWDLMNQKSNIKEMFVKASNSNYAYAYNNLGVLLEREANLFDALSYYIKAANLGESWASNKVAEYYRKTGNGIKAYEFYLKAIEGNYQNICYYAYYNLAKYYYQNGFESIPKDITRYLEYMNIASDKEIIEASIDLFLYYYEQYLKEGTDKDNIYKYKRIIENNKHYSSKHKELVEKAISNLSKKDDMEIELLI